MQKVTARSTALALVCFALTLVLVTAAQVRLAASGQAATPITVASAIATQNGSSATVRGYVVGQPTATSTVVTSGFPNDYALALADAPGESSTSRMVYVQIPAAFRSSFGLASNPALMGRQLDVTGALTSYFAHPGLKDGTTFAVVGNGGGGGGGAIPTGYYDAAAGRTGTALRSALHGIIDDHTGVSYATVWTALQETDEDSSNPDNVIEFYSGESISKTLNGGDPDDWNREHTWAQSHGDFGTATGPGTDLHHLRPTDVTVNSTRGNKDFDNGGSAVSECPDCFTDSNSFEPADQFKGDVARALFYMAIRYEGDDGWPNLELNESTSNGSVPLHGKISVLLAWHAADPVSAAEIRRNDIIYGDWQHNRNPFIDHPEWAESIW
ncbi:endonuclease [Promicromonospora sp. MEB111]|uniref:endonuclease n=1 Tax=Promicromonospora sp. MEB111 TaxID=3040301 RepID=UPI00254B4B7C|nr:endonuclease [Promicromonospora sp. MEB111]